ncbi:MULTISPECIES: hypothetical protein [unclassified Schlesneria]|uniref:hypothetical protein n=1 Tax=Schlesneria TaxID=656899 RepID=UPI002F0831BE
MKLSARCLLSLIVVFFVGLVQGCGGSKTVAEKIVPASGVIKLDGKPVAGINIRFTPINETKSVGGAWAVTKDDGSFTVMHWTNKEGITPGSYMVSFSRMVKQDGSPLGPNDSPAMVRAKETIAARWNNPGDKMAEMTRRVDVPEAGKSDIEFSITSAKNAPKK